MIRINTRVPGNSMSVHRVPYLYSPGSRVVYRNPDRTHNVEKNEDTSRRPDTISDSSVVTLLELKTGG